MSETRYIISDAAKMVDVEPHVLRYWEEELGMEIPRNEMGHRYYTEKEIKLFSNVRDLKEKGFQLKAIKMILSTISETVPVSNIISLDEVRKGHSEEENEKILEERLEEKTEETAKEAVQEEETAKETVEIISSANDVQDVETKKISSEDKMKHFKYIMDSIVMQSLNKNNEVLESHLTDLIADKVIKEMDYLFRMQEEKEEQRFKQIDEIIRKKQKGRKEVAATYVPGYTPSKTKKGLFKNKNSF